MECLFDLVDVIKLLPGKQLHLHDFFLPVGAHERLGDDFVLAAHVTVGRRFRIDRVSELQPRLDGVRAHVEQGGYLSGYLAVGVFHLSRSVGADVYTHGLGHPDGIGHLDQHLVGHAGSHQVLRDMACGISGRTVYLGRVLAAESASAVRPFAAIGVHDDLAAGQSGVAVGAADDEFPGGVDVIDGLVGEEFLQRGLQLFFHAGDQNVDDVFFDLFSHLGVGGELVVLGGDHDSLDRFRLVVVVIADRHLRLGIRPEISDLLVFTPQLGQLDEQLVGQIQRQRHVIGRFVRRVTEHHALVPRTLVLGRTADDAAVDIGGLLVNRGQHPAGIGLEHILALGVADLADDFPGDLLDVQIGVGFYLPRQHDLACGHQRLAGHLALGIECQKIVNQRVGNLVGHLVGMSFRYRL